jgi:hypothetical protein
VTNPTVGRALKPVHKGFKLNSIWVVLSRHNNKIRIRGHLPESTVI